jgi:hypothetical protein
MLKPWKSAPVALGMALLGGLVMPDAMATGCNPGGNCTVEVTVGPNCAITVSPDPLEVPQPRRAKSIAWTIVTKGFDFAPNGIAFKSESDEFVDPVQQGNRFRWKNRHTRPGDHAYDVNVVSTGPNPTSCKLDPVIKNR